MPISTFPRHDYDEDEYLLKPAGLRDTHSEGKVSTLEAGFYGLLRTRHFLRVKLPGRKTSTSAILGRPIRD
jgi:hypothetical protein